MQNESQETAKKQVKTTHLVMCLQNRVREILDRRLAEANIELDQAKRQAELVEIKAAKFENEFK